MANQITHLALSEKLYDTYFSHFNKKDFYLGSVFPDIRYLQVIDRTLTHFSEITFTDVIHPDNNSFNAGVKFHSFVDNERIKFMESNGLYALCPSSPYITQADKSLEDEIIYDSVTDWSQIGNYLVQPSEFISKEYSIPEEKIIFWYSQIKNYCLQKPTDQTRSQFVEAIDLSHEVAAEINTLMEVMRNNDQVTSLLKRFSSEFDSLINLYK